MRNPFHLRTVRSTLARLAAAIAMLLASTSPASAAFVNPDIVKGTTLFEGYGSATHIGSRRLFAWSNEVGRVGTDLAAYVETNGGTVTHINAKRTTAYVGGFDQGTDRVIFQQTHGGESDLFLYDLSDDRRTPIRRLNDEEWQWNPSIDSHRGTTWITYGVNRFGGPTAMWRLFLFNTSTGERTLLAETTNRCGCLFPGTVAYPWVTWAVGDDATAWRYDIRTGERTPLLPTDQDEYGVAVTPEGTTYVARSGDRCGSGAALYRVDRNGVPFLLHEIADGFEPANLSVDFIGPHDRLYFDRRNCKTGSADVMRLRRADVIGDPARPAPAPSRGDGGGDGGFRRSEASSGASPRTR
ncbi:MAG: hypothetical protein M3Q20_00385 [Actinomycetota bacterium]|nr:hypothetical protein [Actinomycetota bacterium]